MPVVDTGSLEVLERLAGWHGRYFHSPSMTFAHYDFVRGASIHEHFHRQEEVHEVIEGELEVTIDGVASIARSGVVIEVGLPAARGIRGEGVIGKGSSATGPALCGPLPGGRQDSREG